MYTYNNYKYFKSIKNQITYINDEITDYEIKHLKLYTGAHGYDINKELRSNIKNNSYQNVIDTIDNIFDNIPSIKEPIILWRELSVDLGKNYKDEGFLSTTTDLSTIYSKTEDRNNTYILELTIPSGSKILPIMKYSQHPSEYEILLKRGSHLLVTNELNKNGYIFLHTLYTPPEFITTNNLSEINSVVNTLNTEYENIKTLILNNLESLYLENLELEGDIDSFIESINIYIDDIINRGNLSSINKELIFNSLKDEINKLYR